ncbi:hypothetical protein C427_5565 [Paraglaciecola psychrophila 170]|uniref:Uncharacterized protein n=1 Tax=Paraglaciecola psychrophila 170 TaxID=1129794 RepID=K6ZLR4_9ALTE|nr:hypothetical protein C427_5565 [Paraglaciecola psychrophila 170]GAC36901.1 hypothetical protein GPSY_1266 [Paraglaciecola psychrophila 170]
MTPKSCVSSGIKVHGLFSFTFKPIVLGNKNLLQQMCNIFI